MSMEAYMQSTCQTMARGLHKPRMPDDIPRDAAQRVEEYLQRLALSARDRGGAMMVHRARCQPAFGAGP
jgi:hypothetical protein